MYMKLTFYLPQYNFSFVLIKIFMNPSKLGPLVTPFIQLGTIHMFNSGVHFGGLTGGKILKHLGGRSDEESCLKEEYSNPHPMRQ